MQKTKQIPNRNFLLNRNKIEMKSQQKERRGNAGARVLWQRYWRQLHTIPACEGTKEEEEEVIDKQKHFLCWHNAICVIIYYQLETTLAHIRLCNRMSANTRAVGAAEQTALFPSTYYGSHRQTLLKCI